MIESVLAVGLGVALAAAVGFRVFVPLLVMSLAAREGLLSLANGFEWISSTTALVVLAVATVLEIGAYYVPWLDALLDAVAAPAAVVAGVVVSASVVTDLDPLLKWTLAVIAGGGMAAAVKLAAVAARQVSTVVTAGLGNPLLSTLELGSSLLLSLLAITGIPLLALGVAIGLLVWLRRRLRRRMGDPAVGSPRLR